MINFETAGGLTNDRLWTTESQINELFNDYIQTEDYRRITSSQINHHSQIWPSTMSRDEKEQIGCMALWNSMRKYRKNQGAKFTSYFINQIRFEYMNYLNRNYNRVERISYSSLDDCCDPSVYHHNYEEVDVRDLMDRLPGQTKLIVQMRFFENRSLKDISTRLAKIEGKRTYSTEWVRRLIVEGLKEMQNNATRTNNK